MNQHDLVRLKGTKSSGGREFAAGTRVKVISIDAANPSIIEVQVVEGEHHAMALLKLAKDDLLAQADIEIFQAHPFNLLAIRPIDRLNKDIKVEIDTICTNEAGASFFSTSTTWLLFDDITKFFNEVASLKAKEVNKTELTSASDGEFLLQLWQRHGKPVANVFVGRDRTIQSQVHHDQLATAFEVDNDLQEIIDGFRKLAFGKVSV